MAALTRSAALTGFAQIARQLGLDPSRLADAARVPRAALRDPDLLVASRAIGRLLDLTAEKAGIDDLGLRLAEGRKLSNMGIVALIAREQPNLRKALEVMAQYQWLQSEGLMLTLDEAGDDAIARLHLAGRIAGETRQPMELAMGVLCLNLRTLAGAGFRPKAVRFRHGPPSDIALHLRVFRVRPEFLASSDALVFPRRMLEAALPDADPVFAREARRYVDRRAPDTTLSARTGELIVLLLPTGTCTADRVAAHLGMTRRTLHRKLAAEGTGFHQIMEDKRRGLVLAAITDRRRSVGAIAAMSGFSSAAAFSHWYRRCFGQSARQARAGPL